MSTEKEKDDYAEKVLDASVDLCNKIDQLSKNNNSKELKKLLEKSNELYQELGNLLITEKCYCPSLNDGITTGFHNKCKRKV